MRRPRHILIFIMTSSGSRGNFASNISFLDQVGSIKPEAELLEIGSGQGHLVKYLTEHGFRRVVGTEVNQDYIEFAQTNFGLELKQMSGQQLEFDDGYFDFVLSFDVFEHIAETDQHLREVRRVLKSEGHYLLGTPNKWTNIPFEVIKEKSLTKYKNYHVALHDYWQLKNRLSKHGFHVCFVPVRVVNEHFRQKLDRYLGPLGRELVKLINPDRLPIPLRTNFYVIAQKL